MNLVALCLITSAFGIRWRLVVLGMAAQAVLALVFLSWDYGNQRLRMLGDEVENFLGLSKAGSEFVFGATGATGLTMCPAMPTRPGPHPAPRSPSRWSR